MNCIFIVLTMLFLNYFQLISSLHTTFSSKSVSNIKLFDKIKHDDYLIHRLDKKSTHFEQVDTGLMVSPSKKFKQIIFRRTLTYGYCMLTSLIPYFPRQVVALTQRNQFVSTYDLDHVFDNIEPDGDFSSEDFDRLDESSDQEFYSNPRYVEHIDSEAILALENFHGNFLKALYTQKHDQSKINILDLCSSWVSHVPTTAVSVEQVNRFVGLGMNMAELEANKRLTERFVQDLNNNFTLPFENRIFDTVLLQLSIDYLIHPVEVMKEISRILQPNGTIIISFSNRLFINKAVAIWTGKSDLEHIETVGRYLCNSLGFNISTLKAYDITSKTSKVKGGDPIYIVTARTSY